MLFDVLNFISKMLDYQPENKNRKNCRLGAVPHSF
jgi:hypothetical protein